MFLPAVLPDGRAHGDPCSHQRPGALPVGAVGPPRQPGGGAAGGSGAGQPGGRLARVQAACMLHQPSRLGVLHGSNLTGAEALNAWSRHSSAVWCWDLTAFRTSGARRLPGLPPARLAVCTVMGMLVWSIPVRHCQSPADSACSSGAQTARLTRGGVPGQEAPQPCPGLPQSTPRGP